MNRIDVRVSLSRLQAELEDYWQQHAEDRPGPVRPAAYGVMCEQCGRYVDPNDAGVWFEAAGIGVDERGDLVERGAPIALLAAVAYCRECRR